MTIISVLWPTSNASMLQKANYRLESGSRGACTLQVEFLVGEKGQNLVGYRVALQQRQCIFSYQLQESC